MSFMELVGYLTVVGTVLYAAYIVSRVVGKTTNTKLSLNKSKELSIKETMMLSPTKKIHILNVGESQFLISESKETISFLTKLESSTSLEEERNAKSFN